MERVPSSNRSEYPRPKRYPTGDQDAFAWSARIIRSPSDENPVKRMPPIRRRATASPGLLSSLSGFDTYLRSTRMTSPTSPAAPARSMTMEQSFPSQPGTGMNTPEITNRARRNGRTNPAKRAMWDHPGRGSDSDFF